MPSRGKIALLPNDIREWLHKTFIDRAYGDIVDVTNQLNLMLEMGGVPIKVGKSAVGAESQRVRRAQEAIAAVTRNMQLIANSAQDDADMRGEALNAMVSTQMFEILLTAQEAEAETDVATRMKLMNQAALGAARLTSSSVRQRKFRAEVEERAKAAAAKVGKIAKQGGMDAKTVAEIRASILGIAAKREVPPPPLAQPAAEGNASAGDPA